FIVAADWIIDLGPGAGPRGGHVVAHGSVADICQSPESVTGQMLQRMGIQQQPTSEKLTANDGKTPVATARSMLKLSDCCRHNLQNITVEIPVGVVTGVAGVSGSGKTTVVFEGLLPALQQQLGLSSDASHNPGTLDGANDFAQVMVIDKGLPGRSPIATPATLSGVWIEFRRLYAQIREARRLGLTAERFSYRHPDSRCPGCRGTGSILVSDLNGATWWSTCPECHGRRFNRSTQTVAYRGFTVADLLSLTIEVARQHFTALPRIARGLDTLQGLGLGYLPLGQSGTTLSGGELQRLWLGRCLSRGMPGVTLYLLDEPTAGLHAAEIELLVKALRQLTAAGHTVVVIEHSLEFLRQVDWLIELGPGSGPAGGRVIASGTPHDLAACATPTGEALRFTGHMLSN
ncbi:MAG: hypothetical protein B7Z55_01510, partial [Planctomycetales bacterium 12-60-4]